MHGQQNINIIASCSTVTRGKHRLLINFLPLQSP